MQSGMGILNGIIRIRNRFFPSRPVAMVVGSAHRNGSIWLYNLLAQACLLYHGRRRLPPRFNEFGTVSLDVPGAVEYLQSQRGACIFKTHSSPDCLSRTQGNIRCVTIHRDPRDVVVSIIHYLARLDPVRCGWGGAALGPRDRILAFLEDGEFALWRLEKWFHATHAVKTSYEALLADTEGELVRILAQLDMSAHTARIRNSVRDCGFQRMRLRQERRGEKDPGMRKGITGDWRNHFDDECVRVFKQSGQGRWNSLLVEMGYESDSDW